MQQYHFDISHIKGKENVIADTLSRIPGSELLACAELCSSIMSLGILHAEDLPAKLCSQVPCARVGYLNGVISIDERETFCT